MLPPRAAIADDVITFHQQLRDPTLTRGWGGARLFILSHFLTHTPPARYEDVQDIMKHVEQEAARLNDMDDSDDDDDDHVDQFGEPKIPR